MISINCNYVLKYICVIKLNIRCIFKYVYVNSKLNFYLFGFFFCFIGGFLWKGGIGFWGFRFLYGGFIIGFRFGMEWGWGGFW